jgi:N-acetylmuramoyl-L-alanine amidase-like protein
MAYRFVQARDYTAGAIREVRAILWHMAEGYGTVSYLTHPRTDNSSHFVIDVRGVITQMVKLSDASHSAHVAIDPDDRDAADCGIYDETVAKRVLGTGWSDINRYVVAVEVEGYRSSGPNAVQTVAIVALSRYLSQRLGTIRGNLGHRDVQDYKPCPGCRFPWAAIGGHGLFTEVSDMGLDLTIADPTVRGVLRVPDPGVPGLVVASGLPVTVKGIRRVHFTARRRNPDGSGYVIGNSDQLPTFVGRSVIGADWFTPDDTQTGDVVAAVAERDEEWRTFLLAGSPGEP